MHMFKEHFASILAASMPLTSPTNNCPVLHAHVQASKEKGGDEDTQRKAKEVQKEELEKQNRASTNSAVKHALGGQARWSKWGKGKTGEIPA